MGLFNKYVNEKVFKKAVYGIMFYIIKSSISILIERYRYTIVYLLFTVCTNLSISVHAQNKKDLERVEKLRPIVTFYDSLLNKKGWFYLTIGSNGLPNIGMKGDILQEYSSISIKDTNVLKEIDSYLGLDNFNKLIKMLKAQKCIQVAATVKPNGKNIISITYRLDLWSNLYDYIFDNGGVLKEERHSYKPICNNVYHDKYKQR